MRLTYETGVATLIQLIVITFLNIANTILSVIETCTHTNGQCTTNILASIVLYVLQVFWFAFVAVIGYKTQTSRSKNYAKFLALLELMTFFFAAINVDLGIKSHNSAVALFTSLIDLVFSAWIITLCYRLNKAGGGRVVNRRRLQ